MRRADDVPREEKKRRLNHLLALQREIALQSNRALVGREVEVLVEGAVGDRRIHGRTRQNRVCFLPADSARPGDVCRATVREVTAWQLQAVPVVGAAA
jgi:tRNA-2-methylthio-N6-dimethylallyladenosine synthase